MPPRIFYHLKKLQEAAEAEAALKDAKKDPSDFTTCLGIILCIGTISFTFTVVGLYMSCMLPNQHGKLCYFEQYRTIL